MEFLKEYRIWLLAALILADVLAAVLYSVDKHRAEKHMWRIPEKVLLGIAVPGGIGARLAMAVFHHKTKKWYFRVWDGFFALLQAALVIWMFLDL